MLEKKEKVLLISFIMGIIVLIFLALFLSNKCRGCDETYKARKDQPIIIYKIS